MSVFSISAFLLYLCIALEWNHKTSFQVEAFATCGTNYRTKCPISAGTVYADSPTNPLTLEPHAALYFSFSVPPSSAGLALSLSVIYNSPDVYIAFNREPKPNDYDISSKDMTNKDFIPLDVSGIHFGDSCEILIATNDKQSHLAAFAISLSNRAMEMPLGIPLRYDLNLARSSALFELPLSQLNATRVSVSPISGITSNLIMTISHPTTNRRWISNVNDTFPDASIIPLSLELTVPYSVSISFTDLDHNSPVSIIITAFIEGDDNSPVYILEGLSQYSFLPQYNEQYFKWSVPAKSVGVEMSLSSITGDADVFMNTCDQGFYHRYISADHYNTQPAQWSSQLSSGRDIIFVSNDVTSSGMVSFCITVWSHRSSIFTMRGVTASTIYTLTESMPIYDSVAPGTYRYYRFIDTAPSEEIRFDLYVTSGEADLYVGCQLQPTGTDEGFPSASYGHYNYSSTNYLEDAIAVQPTESISCSYHIQSDVAVFYLAVYGSSGFYSYNDDYAGPDNAPGGEYVISAMHYGGKQLLSFGIPLRGQLFKREVNAYQVRMGKESESLTITLTPYDGDVDLYVHIGLTNDWWDYDYISFNTAGAIDQVIIPETAICVDCWISIFVVGYTSSRYTIVASVEDTTISLWQSVPLKGFVAEGKCQFYSLTSTVNGTVEAILTPLSGNAAVYLSKSYHSPCAGTPNTISSIYQSSGIVPYAYIDKIGRGDNVFIGVGGMNDNASYTIRATSLRDSDSYPSMYSLLEGVPQDDVILFGSPWKYYLVNLQAGHETMTVRWSTLAGDIAVYIGSCDTAISSCYYSGSWPNETNYKFSSNSYWASVTSKIDVTRKDAVPTTHIIAVEAPSEIAAFQISYTMYSSTLELTPGVSVVDHVFEKELDYFSYYMHSSDKKIRITLTTLAGDPDLFVSTRYKQPNRVNSTWRALDYGDDEIVIDPSLDKSACSYCRYYIAVYGSRESTYSLVITLESTIPSLKDGIPVSGHVALLDWSYYKFIISYGSNRDILASLTTIVGNADIYITTDGSIPSWLNYQYSSTNFISVSDSISIAHDDVDLQFCYAIHSNDFGCLLTIGIFGLADSDYTLSITTSSTAQLIMQNVPVTGTLNLESYKLYKTPILAGINFTHVTFQLHFEIYSGDITSYLSCSTDEPSMTNHEWTFSPVGYADDFFLPSFAFDDENPTKQGCKDTQTIYIAIYGNTAASYLLLATENNTMSYPSLLSGHTMYHSVNYHNFYWYYIRPGKSYEDIIISVTCQTGDIAVYLSSDYEHRAKYSNIDGTVSSYLTSAWSSSSYTTLTYDHDKIQTACQGRASCYLLVGVFGMYSSIYGSSSTFSITYQLKDSTMTLLNGVSVRSVANTGRYEYYKYTLTTLNVDLVISLTQLSGDSDLFVSVGYKPSRYNNTWISTRYLDDVIVIQSQDIDNSCHWSSIHQSCDFYIAAYGYINGSYSLVVTADNGFASRTHLIDGQPQQGHAALGQYVYYEFTVNSMNSIASTIELTLTSNSGQDADLYVSFSGEPGISSYDYRSNNIYALVDSITITPSMQHYCDGCKIYLAVYGYTSSSYTLIASVSRVIELMTNVPTIGIVGLYHYRYYSFRNIDPLASITVSLNIISGDGDLYISAIDPSIITSPSMIEFPTQYKYTWRSLKSGNDIISITYLDPKFCYDCTYIVGVYGFKNSSYTISVTENEDLVLRLLLNHPQKVLVDQSLNISRNNGIRYFSIVPPNSIDNIIISITSLTYGFADIFAQVYNTSTLAMRSTNNSAYILPNPYDPSTYTYSTLDSFDDVVVIPGNFGDEPKTIIIAVVPLSIQFIYSIVASSSATSLILQSGIPQNHYVEGGQNAYFVYYPDDIEDLLISVTARSGDPDLLISRHNPHPYCTIESYLSKCYNYTYIARKYSTDQIFISKDFPCKAVLSGTTISSNCNPNEQLDNKPVYIGIFAISDAKFTITVSVSGMLINLINGVPQLSSTSIGYDCNNRNKLSGACDSTAISYPIQVAYFRYHVYPQISSYAHNNEALTTAGNEQAVLRFSLMLICGKTYVRCNPVNIYISSCSISDCDEVKSHPSPRSISSSNLLVKTNVTSYSPTTIVIDPISSPVYCNPNIKHEECIYYLSIVGDTTNMSEISSFSLTARTPGVVTLVPCDERSADGYKTTIDDESSSTLKGYEICSATSPVPFMKDIQYENMIFSLEQCYGSTNIKICSEYGPCEDTLPTLSSWTYSMNASHVCSNSMSQSDPNQVNCEAIKDSTSYNLIKQTNLIVPQGPENGNYFAVAYGKGLFNLHIKSTVLTTTIEAKLQLPYDIISNYIDEGLPTLQIIKTTDTSFTIQWPHVEVIMPTQNTASSKLGEYLSYSVYVIDNDLLVSVPELVVTSPCGLDYIVNEYPDLVSEVITETLPRDKDGFVARTVSNLLPSYSYTIVVSATCDEACLQSIAKTYTGGPCIYGCQSQSFIYGTLKGLTQSKSSESTTSSSSSMGFYVVSAFASVIVIIIILFTIFVYYRKTMNDTSNLDDPTNTRSKNSFYEMVNFGGFDSSSHSNMSSSVHSSMDTSQTTITFDPSFSDENSSYKPPSMASSASRAMNNIIKGGMNTILGNRSGGNETFETEETKSPFSYSILNKANSKKSAQNEEDDEVEISL